MRHYRHKVLETARYIQERTTVRPRFGLLTGTGLGDSAGAVRIARAFDYADIPHFPVSTVQSHTGRLLFGTIGEKPVVAMQGRFHLYEGYSPAEVTFPIRVMREMGVGTLILSNAAGGFNPVFEPGDIMILRDHINLTGENPLAGENIPEWGIRFPDMCAVYDRALADLAAAGGKVAGVSVHRGVYAGLKGPSLETPAEVRFLRLIGADAVGFSTVQEVIAGVHAGMRILGLSTITNINDPDIPVPGEIDEIIAVANRAAPRLEKMIRYVVEHAE
ncbi:purine-nucleoside phosphorylase [Desulfonema ishimotonii]|uniref:Purine nucleoside phosphorylase n=1 Tax=Desulfonema ishimotonii TaxID=45657 RepID=A0A401FRH7_9BACT|nr:purine-nucleoside phosphorylase [Desulfonema ishimotonii]GBC59569.1 purine-nucleoside phosphorylase [Desulfonema ishimotonii]